MFLLAYFSSVLAIIPGDKVNGFPQAPDTPNFNTYSGYLSIPNSNGKQLHYVLVQSQNNPGTDPLVLWLNGGPGCSSLDGLIYEHGPYVFPDLGTTLMRNPYSWNTNASIIYLQAPAGVGFSILGAQMNNITDDQITAHDNLQALLQFFQGYPEYLKNEFYITGESYGGIYVPTLAYNVLQHNANTPFSRINLKGIAVGNGATDWSVDTTPATMKMLWSHSLFNYKYYNLINENCEDFTNWDSAECDNVVNQIFDTIMNNTNIYDIYRECIPQTGYQEDNRLRVKFLSESLGTGIIPPCVAWQGAYTYFGNTTVKKEFNIKNPESTEWAFCVNLDYRIDRIHGSFYTYPTLIRSGLRIWIYSGDVDASVPFIGTREWINKLQLNTVKDYQPWEVNGQVAGYFQEYEGLTFLTVKGAGHMVPQWKRPEAYYFFNKFLTGSSL